MGLHEKTMRLKINMSKKNKLKKFADLLLYTNVYENYDPKYPKLLKNKDESFKRSAEADAPKNELKL